MLHDGRFLKKALMIACPVALQGMLNTIVNMVDTLMIGGLGSTAIAAVGLANKVFFVFSLLVFGIVSGGGILAAQFWGSGDVKNIRKVLGLCVMLAMVGAMFFVVPALTAPRMVMRIFTTSEGSIELGAKYLRIAALSYPFIALTNVYVAMLRATNKVVFPVICTFRSQNSSPTYRQSNDSLFLPLSSNDQSIGHSLFPLAHEYQANPHNAE